MHIIVLFLRLVYGPDLQRKLWNDLNTWTRLALGEGIGEGGVQEAVTATTEPMATRQCAAISVTVTIIETVSAK